MPAQIEWLSQLLGTQLLPNYKTINSKYTKFIFEDIFHSSVLLITILINQFGKNISLVGGVGKQVKHK